MGGEDSARNEPQEKELTFLPFLKRALDGPTVDGKGRIRRGT